jgi:HAD superfamily hydrolase (TIGR01509 family)
VPRVTGDEKGSERYERLSDGWKRHFQDEELAGVRGQRGTRDLVQALLARDVRVIIGTSADEALVASLLERADLADLKLPATTASDVEASKPEPDIVAAAVGKLGLTPGEVLMVGDTPFDVQSATRAGVRTVFLRCGGDDRVEGALRVFADPAEFAAHLDEVLTAG